MKNVLAVLVIAAAMGNAQERLTMDNAVATALEQNHVLRGSYHDLESSRWGYKNAVSNFLPKVEISSSLTRIDPESDRRANAAVDFIKSAGPSLGVPPSALSDLRPFSYRDAYATNVTVVQPIYNGGAEIIGLRAASTAEEKNEYAYEDTEQDVVARVRTAYYSVLKAQELVDLATESSARTTRWLELTRRSAALGSRTQTDILRFEVQLAADEGTVVNAQNALELAHLQLNEVMGVDLRNTYVLEGVPLPDTSIADAGSQQSLFQFASQRTGLLTPSPVDDSFLAAHPSMRMMEANLHLADLGVDQAWTTFQPRVNLAFQYGWERNNTFSLDGIRPWALSLSVSFPIFNGFGDYTKLQQARSTYERTGEQVESYRRGLLLQATNASLALTSAHKRIEIAKVGLRHAEDVLASVSRRYDLGAASNVDIIDAQTAYTSAKTNFITAVYDSYIAETQLARARGTITH